MALFYKNGFYQDNEGGFVPEGAVQISYEDYVTLLEGQAAGKLIMSNKTGEPVLVEPAPSPYHTWSGTEWEIDKAQQQAVISAEKSAKLMEINLNAQRFVDELARLNETPAFERDTWAEQAQEAKAWKADPAAETPMLAMIAQLRGVPLDQLRKKAYKKAMQFQQIAATVAGQRQAFEDKLNAAETVEQIRAIEVSYVLTSNEIKVS